MSEPIRLQKLLSECGVASRRAAEKLIEAGRVQVNGQTAKVGDKADPEKRTVSHWTASRSVAARSRFALCFINLADTSQLCTMKRTAIALRSL
jgi:16S rRNA U516 pseudouridylate synthase RsuA-like enzyme